MMSPLYAELNRWLALRHAWGSADCITLPADWVLRMRGVDPAEDIRLTYESASEAQRVWRFFSHPLEAVAPRMQRAGLALTSAPVAGDVGVLLLPLDGMLRPHGGLCLGRDWAVKMADGGVANGPPVKVLGAWGVGYHA
ncbi:hypothetical protein GCM10011345_35670 [Gemmobacter megaterium]|nr:hypothetical protein [Gemmobacter megaterium]GGE26559.1 hypothetical protein GCM10011345_35670 [Gemmobacter megaterium]